MNKPAIIILLLLTVAIISYFAIRPKADTPSNPITTQNQTTTYTDESGLQFDYRTGPEGYVLGKALPSVETTSSNVFLRTVYLTSTADTIQEVPVGGEGPQMITVHIYKNTKNQSSSVWANANPSASGIDRKMGEPQETVVGGANAVRYMADGLYATDTVVVAHGGYMYVIGGMFIDEESQIRKDFGSFLDSIRFVQTPEQQ